MPDRLAAPVAGIDDAGEIAQMIREEINDVLFGLFERFIDDGK